MEPRGPQARPRPGRRAEGAATPARRAQGPPRPLARDDLPEALDPHARVVRGRDRPTRRLRPLPARGRPPARARRDDQRHGDGALPLPRRDRDPDVRPGGRGAAGRARRHPGDQRVDRLRASLPGARRRDDGQGAARTPVRDSHHVSGGRQQRVRLADDGGGEARDAVRGGRSRGLRAGRGSGEDVSTRSCSPWPPTARSSSTACRRTTARRSPRRFCTGPSRPCGTRRRTAFTPRRPCWR